jgi:cystathionine beta-lyase/cystathionine gamma-synthase
MEEFADNNVFDPPQPGTVPYRGPSYSRCASLARTTCEENYMNVYGLSMPSHLACLFPSGTGAISAVMSALTRTCSTNGVIVYADELYCDVKRIIGFLPCKSVKVNVFSKDAVLQVFSKFGDQIRIFHYEACANPSGRMFDPTLIPELRALAPYCSFVCDNTWLTGILYNPFLDGVDYVVESCTKYLSDGKCIAGVVCGKHDAMQPILEWCRVFGQHVSNDYARTITSALATLEDRVLCASARASSLAQNLEERQQKLIGRVMYPTLQSHPTFAVNQRLLKRGGPGCLWVFVRGISKTKLMSLVTAIPEMVKRFKTSFGCMDTRVDSYPRVFPPGHYDGDAKQSKGTWIRVSIGYGDNEDEVIVPLLEKIVKAASKKKIR